MLKIHLLQVSTNKTNEKTQPISCFAKKKRGCNKKTDVRLDKKAKHPYVFTTKTNQRRHLRKLNLAVVVSNSDFSSFTLAKTNLLR